MPDPVQLLAILISGALMALVLELVRRRLLSEEYAFIWIAGAVGLMVLSIWRGALDSVARWLGVHYGPALLLLLLGVFVFIAALFFSVVISRHRVQIERLIEDQAILEARLRDLERPTVAATAPEAPADDGRPTGPGSAG